MVLISLQHIDGAVLRRLHISVQAARHLVLASAVMRLHICLIHHIDPVLVAQFVERRIIGIMRSSHRVDVERLHHLDLFAHIFFSQIPSRVRIILMPVHTEQRHDLSVDAETRIVRPFIRDLYLPEAHTVRRDLCLLAVLLQNKDKCIEVRVLCRPFCRIRDLAGQRDRRLAFSAKISRRTQRLLSDQISLCVIQVSLHFIAVFVFSAEVSQINLCLEFRILIIFIQICGDCKITDLRIFFCRHIDIPEDTGISQHILVLDVASVAPPVNLDRDHIFISLREIQRIRDIEFIPGKTVLGISDILSVHPEVHRGTHALKVQEYLLALPGRVNCKCLAVGPHRIALFRGLSDFVLRIILSLCVHPGVVLIGVDHRIVFKGSVFIYIRLPASRDTDIIPPAVVVICLIEIRILLRDPLRRLHSPAELPVIPVEQLVAG